MTDLVPPAVELADLLVAMCERPWPTTEEDRLAWFAALGLVDTSEWQPGEREADTARIRFATPLPGDVVGTASTFRGEFLELSLFAYDDRAEHAAAAREGYAQVRGLVSRGLGAPPVEEWGTASEPACCWQTEVLGLELYCFQRLRSGIMVGPSHRARTEVSEAASAEQEPYEYGA